MKLTRKGSSISMVTLAMPDEHGRTANFGNASRAFGTDASSSLEFFDNKVKLGGGESECDDRMIIMPCPCRCRTCPRCGPMYGRRVQQRLLDGAHQWKRPAMLTLTIDRTQFGDGRDAYLEVTRGKYIARMMRMLGVKRWVWTLEFQMKSGDGWPHWHLIVDLPPDGIDLSADGRLRRLWSARWKFGKSIDLKWDWKSAEHALNYITKYLTKYPEAGFPEWLLDLDHRVRWVGTSKAVGAVVAEPQKSTRDKFDEQDEPQANPDDNEQTNNKAELVEHRPLRERMAECGEMANVFRECKVLGGVRYQFMGWIRRDLVEAAVNSWSGPKIHAEKGGWWTEGRWSRFIDLEADIRVAAMSSNDKKIQLVGAPAIISA